MGPREAVVRTYHWAVVLSKEPEAETPKGEDWPKDLKEGPEETPTKVKHSRRQG